MRSGSTSSLRRGFHTPSVDEVTRLVGPDARAAVRRLSARDRRRVMEVYETAALDALDEELERGGDGASTAQAYSQGGKAAARKEVLRGSKSQRAKRAVKRMGAFGVSALVSAADSGSASASARGEAGDDSIQDAVDTTEKARDLRDAYRGHKEKKALKSIKKTARRQAKRAGAKTVDKNVKTRIKKTIDKLNIKSSQRARAARRAVSTSRVARVTSSTAKAVNAAANTSTALARFASATARAFSVAASSASASLAPLAGVALAFLLVFTLLGASCMAISGYEESSTSNLDGLTETEAQIAQYLFNKGLSDVSVAAIMGNMQQESGCDPAAMQARSKGRGLLQWEVGGRFDDLLILAAKNGVDWTDLETQLDFFWSEAPSQFLAYSAMDYTYSTGAKAGLGELMTFDEWCEIEDVDWATEAFERVYTRASVPNMDARIEYAQAYLAIFRSGGATVTDDETRQAILEAAYYVAANYRTPYVYGGTDIMLGCDCSYFTQWCYAQAGVSIPRTSAAQASAGTLIPISEAEPGDLLWMEGHIGIYGGGTTVIEQTPTYCRVTSLSYQDWVCAVTFE